jgi:thiamine-monophosphate kinase
VKGEFELIAALRERLGDASVPAAGSRLVVGSGDDAAVSEASGAVVTTVDAAIEGVHFHRDAAPLRAIGHKALAGALSDLAAMGAEPGEAYIQLGLSENVSEEDCLELADGLADVARAHRVTIAGGDVTRSPVLLLAVTAMGYASSADELVLRSGAQPGDVLAVTGELGGAAAGLILLRDTGLAPVVSERAAEELRDRQLRPQPRLDAGRALANAGASAMIDISDGLGGDATHLADASGVAARVELAQLPLANGVEAVAEASGADPMELATAGGEDYELLVAMPPERVDDARRALESLNVSLTAIGELAEGEGVELIEPDGSSRPARGFDHLAGRRSPSDRAEPDAA